VSRERWLTLYCLAIGAIGWIWLSLAGPITISTPLLLLFLILALLVESAGFRVPPSDPHSLVGIVLLTAALALGPPSGALVAALSGLIFGILRPLIYGLSRTFYSLVARPVLRSGVRAIAVLLGGALVSASGARTELAVVLLSAVCYALIIQLNRVVRELLQGGRSGLSTWWRSSWRPALSAEVAPLPLAALGAAIYERLGMIYFTISGVALLATSIALRWGVLNLQRQRRSVRELALLNEVSRAIIRSELDVTALCELIYRETSKVVDTSSFHLGLFAATGDQYTLVVRVQDRVRLPPLTVDLPSGDGIVGWMRETGRALLVEDFASELEQLPARPRYQSERPPRSGIYVPLIAGDDVLGSISIQSYRPRAFATDDMRMLSLIADQAAVAISKARVFDQARQRAVQLQAIHDVSERITAILDLDELLPSVVRLIQEHFGYHPVHIFTLEEDGVLVFRASTAESEGLERVRQIQQHARSGLVGAVAAQGQPILVNDIARDTRFVGDDSQTKAELAVPLRFGDQRIGVLDVQSTEAGRFQESDLFVVRTLADQIAVAIESARAFSAQREEAWTLNALLQVAENTARAASLDELLPIVVRLPTLLLGCDRCYCLLWDRERGVFTPLAAYGLPPEQRAALIGQPIAESEAPLLAAARHSMASVTTGGLGSPVSISAPALSTFGGGVLLALPLTARGAMLGVLVADYGSASHRFTTREMTLYTGIANQVAGALESALLAEEAAKVARLEGELRVARDIQTALLPAAPPQLADWDIAADWRSARLVGGDFYDFWRLPTTDHRPLTTDHRQEEPRTENQALTDNRQQTTDNRQRATQNDSLPHPLIPSEPPPVVDGQPSVVGSELPSVVGRQLSVVGSEPPSVVADGRSPDFGFVIADVSDKGVPAAMFMALSRSLVRAAALDGSSPAVALTRANRWITRDSESAMFVTLFYGVLQPENGLLHYTCAGHNPPLLFRADGSAPIELKTPGIALGVLEHATLGEDAVTIAPGDILVCYTDGVTEAINAAEEPFGIPRLIEVVAAQRDLSAAHLLDAINAALLAFTGGLPPFDDLTMVVLKRAAETADLEVAEA
jgi:serine phosphatase RsbU (regulator of sigma subunit)/putative methionine-R-sulfoxide reductase with GAF domain